MKATFKRVSQPDLQRRLVPCSAPKQRGSCTYVGNTPALGHSRAFSHTHKGTRQRVKTIKLLQKAIINFCDTTSLQTDKVKKQKQNLHGKSKPPTTSSQIVIQNGCINIYTLGFIKTISLLIQSYAIKTVQIQFVKLYHRKVVLHAYCCKNITNKKEYTGMYVYKVTQRLISYQ